MSEMNRQGELSVAAQACFSDDGTLDLGELNTLLSIALRDNVIDEVETAVLEGVLSRLSQSHVTPVVWQRIQEIERKYNL